MGTRDLGVAGSLGAEAVGRPGQRRFRLFVRTTTSSAILWMEKEQLLNLSLVIDRILARASEGRILRTEARAGGLLSTQGEMPDDFPVPATYDFQVGQLRLSFDEEQGRFVLAAVPFGIVENEEEEPQLYLRSDDTLSFLFSIEQAQLLTSRITFLMNSGRPLCPLCHTPLGDGPHACVKQNGHQEIIRLSTGDGEGEEEE